MAREAATATGLGAATEEDFKPPVDREKINLFDVAGMKALMLGAALGIGTYALLLPVVPLGVIAAGGSQSLAGTATAVFMAACVVTQIATAAVVRAVGYRVTILVASFLLGVPALGHIWLTDPSSTLVISAIRGIGFGAICVAQYALAGQLAPEGTLGRVSGTIGLGTGAAQMVLLPAGLAITDSALGFTGAYVLCAVLAVIGCVIALFCPDPKPTVLDEDVEMNPQDEVRVHVDVATGKELTPKQVARIKRARMSAKAKDSALHPVATAKKVARGVATAPIKTAQKVQKMRPGRVVRRIYRRPRPDGLVVTVVPALVLCSGAMAYGAVSSFLPASVREADAALGATLAGVMLSIVGGAQMLVRFVIGQISDKLGRIGVFMIPGVLSTMVGMGLFVAGVAAGGLSVPVIIALVVGAVLFGAGFGMIQNDSMLEMFLRVPRDKVASASTIWNAAIDSGTGIGSMVLGVVAASFGFVGAFIGGTAFLVIGLIAEIYERVTKKQHER